MKWIRALLSLILTITIFWGLDTRHGLIPPLGKLLNPFAGFWQNSSRQDHLPEELVLPQLQADVQVVWDSRHVPHIFARNNHDLFLAQGYVTARDRLWQMEFISLFAAGRLSEVVGKAALQLDRMQRRSGMAWAAEKKCAAFNDDPDTKQAIESYGEGVNAYINSLTRKSLPVEYKILDYSPEVWTEEKSGLLVLYMASDLSSGNSDALLTQVRDELGESAADQLFPFIPPLLDPVIPRGTVWDFKVEGSSEPERSSGSRALSYSDSAPVEPENDKGSNSWAVSGRLTGSGFPILCNDMHLRLSLPSIWYEIQLNAPGINAYGVTFPGAPTIIVGYNDKIAWGCTAALSDVLDWYAIQFRDETHEEYLYDGEWRKTIVRSEEIKIRGEKPYVDRVLYTHHGPVVWLEDEKPVRDDAPKGAALRWLAHDPSNELLTFYKLNRAQNYEDYVEALRHFECPAQNFAYADSEGNIAIWHNGKFPLRQKGQGRYILDGSKSTDEWQEWVPQENNPHVKNPEREFVSSANQAPADETYPYYLGWDYLSFERGTRINEILSEMKDISPEDMVRMQNDTLNIRARRLLPTLLNLLADKMLNADERASFEELLRWSFENSADLAAPTIWDQFWVDLNSRIWDDEKRGGMRVMMRPLSDVVIDLILNQSDSPFFDDKSTPEKEKLEDIVFQAFRSANKALAERWGPFGRPWIWGKTRGTDLKHLALIPGLGRERLETSGESSVINAIQKTSGPSWRVVVSLGPEVKAWGIYPGGQSGNPGSEFYDNAVDDWVAGKAYELIFLHSADEQKPGIVGRTTLRGAR